MFRTMLFSRRTAAGAAVCAAALAALALVLPDASFAKPSDIGKNLGNEIRNWGMSIFLGIATFAGLKTFASRNIGEAVVLTILVVVVGGFVLAQDAVQDVVKSLWQSLAS